MLNELLSSPSRLVKFFRKSRDAWKARSLKNQSRVRELDGRVRDLERSREKWKSEAKQAEREVADLKRQLAQLQRSSVVVDRTPLSDMSNRAMSTTPSQSMTETNPSAPPFCPQSSMVTH